MRRKADVKRLRDVSARVRRVGVRCDGAGRMTDFATDLKTSFDAMMFDRLEAYWGLPDGKSFERSDDDENAIGLFKVLLASVDAIPSSLTKAAEELRAAEPQKFRMRCRAVWDHSAMDFRQPAPLNLSRSKAGLFKAT
jgi:hypothetical protein